MYDDKKYRELVAKIEKSSLKPSEKDFLKLAASRHIVFSYQTIADYYAHSDEGVQDLMEDSALVIVDFDKAIENGFVKMTKDILNEYQSNDEE